MNVRVGVGLCVKVGRLVGERVTDGCNVKSIVFVPADPEVVSSSDVLHAPINPARKIQRSNNVNR